VADELGAIRQLKARYCGFLDAATMHDIAAAGYTGFTLA
jgi:hypothetical protein